MEVVGWTAAILSFLYLIVAAFVRWGTYRRAPQGSKGSTKPRVSVVIAARDEEERLGATLASLRKQTYRAEFWDVTVADDRSRDRTADVVRGMAEGWPQLRLVQVKECPPGLGGKQHALAVGIESASGEIILMTDADCTVPPTWIQDVASAFAPDVGLVAGVVTFPSSCSLWVRLQQADLAHLMGTAWGFIGLGMPFSGIGSNLAVRRAAYDEVGGYRALGFTIAEDCALTQAVARTTAWNTVTPPSSATVLTDPPQGLRAFLMQRARWASASRSLRGWTAGLLTFVLVQRILVLAVTVCASLEVAAWLWPLAAWSAWFLGDALVLTRMSSAHGEPSLAVLSPVVTLWQAVYQPIIGLWIRLAPRGVRWRGSSYSLRRQRACTVAVKRRSGQEP